MSNRTEKFNSEVIAKWNEITESVKSINAKALATSDRDEIARMKKVVAYFSEMIASIDPDFVPMQIVNNLSSPLSNIISYLDAYKTNGGLNYINTINNDYLDTLLRDVMPYIFYKGRGSVALQRAFSEYSETIQSHTDSYLEGIKNNAIESEEIKEKISKILENLQEKEEKLNEYNDYLFSENEDGLKNKFESLFNEAKSQLKEINELHSEIFEEDGIEQKIKEDLENSKSEYQKIVNMKSGSSEMLDELENFHTKIFGEKNEEGELSGGLKQEIEIRRSQLDKFKKEQEERYKELNNQIESLLPSATSAGLGPVDTHNFLITLSHENQRYPDRCPMGQNRAAVPRQGKRPRQNSR